MAGTKLPPGPQQDHPDVLGYGMKIWPEVRMDTYRGGNLRR
jgi:hypothetical protein